MTTVVIEKRMSMSGAMERHGISWVALIIHAGALQESTRMELRVVVGEHVEDNGLKNADEMVLRCGTAVRLTAEGISCAGTRSSRPSETCLVATSTEER